MGYKNETREAKDGYVLVSGLQDGTQFGMEDFLMSHAETMEGHYIGDEKTALMLRERGISPELASPSHHVCSIGFSNKDGKWYGWSHRAICGFGIGHIAQKGDCSTESGWVDGIDPKTGKPDEAIVPVGFEVKTLDDAKRVAIAFASSVS